MATATPPPLSLDAPYPSTDQHFVIHGVTWRSYTTLREALDIPGLRMTFLEGALELMSPSSEHESLKTRIGRLLEVFALESDLPLYGYGSTTFRREANERGLEPDECYCLGAELREYPDIAIEVVLTSGGIDRLAVYQGLGVPEVWFWMDDRFQIFLLAEAGYAPANHSKLVPDLSFDLLAEFVRRTDQPAAVRELRDTVRAGR